MKAQLNVKLNPFDFTNNHGLCVRNGNECQYMRINSNHVLTPIYQEINDMVDGEILKENCIKTPLYQALAYVNGMYHDAFNNGGGNNCFWGKSALFQKALRQSKMPKEFQAHLVARMQELVSYMGRGRNFAWPRDTLSMQVCVEVLLVDLTYFAAKALNLDSLKALEKSSLKAA
ncbi:hypothetical protein [Vibrio owensii]|uniref:hypothetical protein n=1 Tax=Vibrio harveyi group TaxID=717610 RepID=UPI003CC55640